MDVYILRHGIAEPRGGPGMESDDERPLSKDGIEKMKKAAKGMRAVGLTFDAVLTSPLLRAWQTAEIVCSSLGLSKPTECRELGHKYSAAALIRQLLRLPPASSVLLVGHEPDQSGFISELLAANDDVNVSFRKGALCLLIFNGHPSRGQGQLRWLLLNKHLGAIGERS